MTEEVFLTIGIPTYLREESLNELLVQVSQTSPTKLCEILIINNGPAIDLDKQIPMLEKSGYLIKKIQNKRNCGGQENVIRIYENASGEYVWFLGDDDRLYPDSILNVIDSLQKYPCDCLLFDADAPDHPEVRLPQDYHNLNTILGGAIPLRKLMFAPLAVIRLACILEALPQVRLNLGCFAPQLLLLVLGNVKRYFYLKRKIITCEDVNIGRDQRLSLLPVFLGIGNLVKIDVSRNFKRMLLRLLRDEWFYFLRPTRVISALMIAKMQGTPKSVTAFFLAGFRNYPLWLAILFALSVVIATITPRTISKFVLILFANKILKKNVQFDKYFSDNRI